MRNSEEMSAEAPAMVDALRRVLALTTAMHVGAHSADEAIKIHHETRRILARIDGRPLANDRTLRKGGEESRINLATAGLYAVSVGGRIYQAATVAELRAKVAPLGWK